MSYSRVLQPIGLYDAAGNAIGSTSGSLNVAIAGGSFSLGFADESAFTYGTTIMTPIGGVYQDTSPTIASGKTGGVRMTQFRGLHINLRDSSGNELLGQKTMALSVPVAIASDQSAFPIKLEDGSGSAVNKGQAAMSGSLPVVIASDQSNVSVLQPDVTTSGSITSTQSVTLNTNGLGTVGIQVTGTWTGTLVVEASVDGVNFVSTTAIILSSGAPVSSIAANGAGQMQAAGMSAVRIRGNSVASGTAVVTLRGNQSVASVMLDNSLPTGSNVIGAVTQSGTWSVRNQDGNGNLLTSTANALDVNLKSSSITLNTSAAQSGTWSMRLQDGSGNSITEGQKTMSLSLPVAIASDQSAIPVKNQDANGTGITSSTQGSKVGLNVSDIGYSQANAPVYNSYSTTNITTSAYVQLIASTTSDCQELEIYDTSGQILYLATGPAASEVNQLIIPQGGNGRVKFRIAAGTRVSAKAITATANTGALVINLYG